MEDEMAEQEPATELGGKFSSAGAHPTQWSQARAELQEAETYWLTTVRPDGRPHVTTLIGVWFSGALYFCTGPGERKTKNLVQNSQCILTTGCNHLDRGLDVVVEGAGVRVTDEDELGAVADTYESKYGAHFTSPDGTFFGLGDGIRGGAALLYRVVPSTAFGFAKGAQFSQTRWQWS